MQIICETKSWTFKNMQAHLLLIPTLSGAFRLSAAALGSQGTGTIFFVMAYPKLPFSAYHWKMVIHSRNFWGELCGLPGRNHFKHFETLCQNKTGTNDILWLLFSWRSLYPFFTRYRVNTSGFVLVARKPKKINFNFFFFFLLCRAHKLQTIFPLYFVLQPHLLPAFSSPYNSGLSNKF